MGLRPFQEVLDLYREDVLRFLIASTGPDEAEDCFQETFLAALGAYPRLENERNVRGWLLKIAARKAIDAHRARSRRPVPVSDVADSTATADHFNGTGIWESVRGLPHKQRTAVIYRFVNDLAYRDIAELMDSSPEAARQNVSEALRTLRKAGV